MRELQRGGVNPPGGKAGVSIGVLRYSRRFEGAGDHAAGERKEGRMKRATTWVLTAVAVVGLALAAAADFAHFHAPALPGALLAIAIVCALLLILRALPLNARRPVVFLLAAVVIVALSSAGSPISSSSSSRRSSRTRSAPPSRRSRRRWRSRQAKVEQWPPQLAAIGTLRAYQGIVVAPQVAGVVSAIHFESGDDVAAGAPLVDLDTSVEAGRSRQRARPAQERQRHARSRPGADRQRQYAAVDASTRRWRRAIRPPRRSSARAR